jgi:putative aldouronate transport system substrate-binding protein
MNAGKGFSYFTNTKPGIDGEWERKAGVPITCIETVNPTSTTSGVANLWFIAHNSQKPEKAMQVLNEMYINPQLADILVNGIEGEHFAYSSDRTVIDYPQGVNASNTTYSSVAWAWLNELITTPWAQDGQNIWKETTAFNESAVNSVAKGFMWDNSAVMNEITACNNVTAKYKNALDGGQLNPATTLPQFIKELKDAGVDAIIAEKQRQLNAWLNS